MGAMTADWEVAALPLAANGQEVQSAEIRRTFLSWLRLARSFLICPVEFNQTQVGHTKDHKLTCEPSCSETSCLVCLMSLQKAWEDSFQQPFRPLVPKESQFLIGFTLLLAGQ